VNPAELVARRATTKEAYYLFEETADSWEDAADALPNIAVKNS